MYGSLTGRPVVSEHRVQDLQTPGGSGKMQWKVKGKAVRVTERLLHIPAADHWLRSVVRTGAATGPAPIVRHHARHRPREHGRDDVGVGDVFRPLRRRVLRPGEPEHAFKRPGNLILVLHFFKFLVIYWQIQRIVDQRTRAGAFLHGRKEDIPHKSCRRIVVRPYHGQTRSRFSASSSGDTAVGGQALGIRRAEGHVARAPQTNDGSPVTARAERWGAGPRGSGRGEKWCGGVAAGWGGGVGSKLSLARVESNGENTAQTNRAARLHGQKDP